MHKDVVEYIVKSLVSNPKSVTVIEKLENSKVFLEIHVDQKDRGKVIGKEGKTIRSIRALANAIEQQGRELIIEIAK